MKLCDVCHLPLPESPWRKRHNGDCRRAYKRESMSKRRESPELRAREAWREKLRRVYGSARNVPADVG